MASIATVISCGRDNEIIENYDIVGKWEYRSAIRERINLDDPSDIWITEQDGPSNLTMEIREFKNDGTMSQYSEINTVDVGDYAETWDWTLSSNKDSLFLSNGRDNAGNELGYGDHVEEVLKLNEDTLVTRYTASSTLYTFIWTTTYIRK